MFWEKCAGGYTAIFGPSKFPNLLLYFTEWSTSYTPRDLVRDSSISAPYILGKLKATEGLFESMSY